MKNKAVACLLAAALALSLCACKKQQTPTEKSAAPTAPTGGLLAESERAAGSYFDDAVFVGDSISDGLRTYEETADVLGTAQFLTAVSLSATNALWDVSARSVHPVWEGEKMKVEDTVPRTGANKVYVMLGMNDIIAVGVENGLRNLETLCDNILLNAPDITLILQSVTPIANEGRTSGTRTLNNETIQEFNDGLLRLCEARQWYYLDVAACMADENGYLQRAYCSDPNGMGMHLTNAGCAAWADYLLTHSLPNR